jgi:hypothetical protein
MSQILLTTESESKELSSNSPSSSEITKTTPNTPKTPYVKKQFNPSIPPSKLDYDFLEYLKRTKENISLFELMKLP